MAGERAGSTNDQGSTQCLLERADATLTLPAWLEKNRKEGGANRSGTLQVNGGEVGFIHIFDKPHQFLYFHKKSPEVAYTLHCVEVGAGSWGSWACNYQNFDSLGERLAM